MREEKEEIVEAEIIYCSKKVEDRGSKRESLPEGSGRLRWLKHG